MRRFVGFLVLGILVGGLPLLAQADNRLAAFSLECFGPWVAGFHTRATLVGSVQLAHRTVWTVASCADGPSTAVWPTFTAEDGAVQHLEVTLVTVVEDAAHQTVVWNYCRGTSENGFLTLRCLADVEQGGEVQFLVSIAP
jgi:hypothetical protein